MRTNGIYEECAGHGADEGLSWVDGYFKYTDANQGTNGGFGHYVVNCIFIAY